MSARYSLRGSEWAPGIQDGEAREYVFAFSPLCISYRVNFRLYWMGNVHFPQPKAIAEMSLDPGTYTPLSMNLINAN